MVKHLRALAVFAAGGVLVAAAVSFPGWAAVAAVAFLTGVALFLMYLLAYAIANPN